MNKIRVVMVSKVAIQFYREHGLEQIQVKDVSKNSLAWLNKCLVEARRNSKAAFNVEIVDGILCRYYRFDHVK